MRHRSVTSRLVRRLRRYRSADVIYLALAASGLAGLVLLLIGLARAASTYSTEG